MGVMKIFTCKDHDGYWPVPTASVIIAENEEQAFSMLKSELEKRGIKDDRFTLQEVDLTKQQVIVLSDGDY